MFRRFFVSTVTAVALSFGLSGCVFSPKPLADVPPIVMVHGNGDNAAVWQNIIWRFESNGWPRDRLFALQQPYPLARDDDGKPQEGRSSTAEHMAFIKAEVEKILTQTGAKQVVLLGNSRGGLGIRNYIQNGGGDKTVSHAILGGTPSHGVWANPGLREGSEFSGTGPFLKGLNAAKNTEGHEVTGPVKWLTLRSDFNDKYAQPEGDWIGAKGKPTLVKFDGPELKGAENQVLPRVDHRETSFSPSAFHATFKFITGKTPTSATVWPEVNITLSGMVTGMGTRSEDKASGNFSNNLPIAKSRLDVYAVHYETGLRVNAEPDYSLRLGPNGQWGPFKATPGVPYEFVIHAPSYATTHIYHSPFLRSSSVVHLKADRIIDADIPAQSIVTLNRPRGYLDPSNNHIKFDGQFPPAGVTVTLAAGVASTKIKTTQAENRAISAEFHTDAVERIVGRTWSAKESHIVWLEISQ